MLARAPVRFALAAMLALSACSQGDQQAQQDWPEPDPLVYEIANADGEVEGWMLGTIHALPDGAEWRTETIEGLITEADLLMVEVAELNDRAALAATFSVFATTPGIGPLEPRVDPELHDELEAMIELSDYSPSDFASIEDWAAAIMIARVGAPGDPANGVDKALITAFEGRDVRGFETAAQQLGIFDQLSAQDQRDLLEGTIREWIATRDGRPILLNAWLTGDPDTLTAATTTGIMADPELRQALLVGRNEDWLGPLIQALEQGPKPLIAVGAAHLVGPDGLEAMLETRGYRVKRLDNNTP